MPTSAETITIRDQNGELVKNALIISGFPTSNQKNTDIAIMDQVDKQFMPRVLSITSGQLVSFPNSDNIRHHVYSFSKTKPFEIKLYSGVPGAPIAFDSPGVVVLGCNIHDQMVGYIYVAESSMNYHEIVNVSDENGTAEIALNKIQKLKVWHENLKDRNNALEITDIATLKTSRELVIPLTTLTPAVNNGKKKFGKKFNRSKEN